MAQVWKNWRRRRRRRRREEEGAAAATAAFMCNKMINDLRSEQVRCRSKALSVRADMSSCDAASVSFSSFLLLSTKFWCAW
jgi:hypothetical protein